MKKKLSIFILSLYLIIANYSMVIDNGYQFNWLTFSIVAIISIIIAFVLINYLPKLFDKVKLKDDQQLDKKGFIIIIIICVLLISFLLFVFYPGGCDSDIMWQYFQGINLTRFNNWHSPIHTLLIFRLPNLIKPKFIYSNILNVSIFGLSYLYLLNTLRQRGVNKKIIYGIFAFNMLNPFLMLLILTPYKDILFASIVNVLIGLTVKLGKNNEYTNNIYSIIYVFLCVFALLVRRNAALLIIPILLYSLFCYYPRFRKWIVLTLFASFYFFANTIMDRIPMDRFYLYLEQMVPTFQNIWANVTKNKADLSDETYQLMDDILPLDEYQDYVLGDVNTIRFEGHIYDSILVDNLGLKKILEVTMECIKKDPKSSVEAVLRLYNMSLGVDSSNILYYFPESYQGISPLSDMNDYSIQIDYHRIDNTHAELVHYYSDTNEVIKTEIIDSSIYGLDDHQQIGIVKIIRKYADFFKNHIILRILFGSFGLINLIDLIITLICFIRKNKVGFIFFAIFLYNMGTTFLLSGPDYRYFFFNLVITLPLIIIYFKDYNENNL